MRTATRFGLLVLAVALAVAGGRNGSAGTPAGVMIRPEVEVTDATRDHVELVRWAAERFERAGLTAPSVRIAFHVDPDGCGEHLGFAKGDRVDVCTTLVNAMTRRVLLHEMAHIWLDQNLTAAVRARFLDVRGLTAWNASSDPWPLRGYEQGAEILAWALGERILSAQIPNNGPGQLGRAYELLTGRPIPHTR